MKRSIFITIISLLIPLLGISQTKATYIDDIYAKPSDAKAQVSNQTTKTRPTPNYKNGAREIVYTEREKPNTKTIHDTVYVEVQANEVRKNNSSNVIHGIIHDTIYLSGPATDNRENSAITSDTPFVVGEANDSTENNQEQGHYLNGFKGTQSDQEYAERIRRFHNPKYEIFIGDPRYNDIYFLNDNDWNVYIDGSYAYVTPTWTNPAWWNYNYSPYDYYGGYGWNNPWGYNNFYGGFGFGFGGYYDDYFGFGGYYGYDYPYYGYGYPYSGYGSWGGGKRHEDADQRLRSGISSREGGYLYNSASKTATTSSRGTANQYTAISGSNNVSSRSRNLNTTSRSVTSGIGLIRTGFASRSLNRGLSSSSYTTYTRSGISAINTRPRTTNYNSSNYLSRSINSNSGSSTVRGTTSSRSFYSGTNSTYYPSSSSSESSRSSSPSYSSGSSTSSGSSYSGGGSSSGSSGGGSRSSGGGGGRR